MILSLGGGEDPDFERMSGEPHHDRVLSRHGEADTPLSLPKGPQYLKLVQHFESLNPTYLRVTSSEFLHYKRHLITR